MTLFGDILSGAALDDLIRVHGETATIQRVTETPDEYGSQTEEWNDLVELTGHFYALSGREVERFKKLEVEATYAFLCKAPETEITEKDRLVKGEAVFDIKFVEPIAAGSVLRIALQERK